MAKAKKLPSGSWRVLLYIGKENGKRKYKSITAPTKREAEYLAASYANEMKIDNVTGMTVGQAIRGYIEAKSNILSPTTLAGYKTNSAKYYKQIENISIEKLTSVDVQNLINKHAKKYSVGVLKNIAALLTASLSMYAPDKKITIAFPAERKREMQIPTTEEVQALLKASKGKPIYIAIRVAAELGLRRSEIMALTREDIDRERGIVRVNKALVSAGGKDTLKTTKTAAGVRDVPATDDLIEEMIAFCEKNENGRLLDYCHNWIEVAFKNAKDKAGVTCRFHDLRHYHASLLLALGIPDKYAMKRMGHSTTAMLKNVYQHLMKDKQDEVDEQIKRALNGLFKS